MLDRWALCAMLPQLSPLSSLRAPSHVLYLSTPLGKKIRNTFLPCMNRPVIPPILLATPTLSLPPLSHFPLPHNPYEPKKPQNETNQGKATYLPTSPASAHLTTPTRPPTFVALLNVAVCESNAPVEGGWMGERRRRRRLE
ncbi:hypothetical protein BT69DRAFT_1323911, partial [Atractiella rhizophila]